MAHRYMDMFGLPSETILVVGGGVVLSIIILFLWGIFYRGEE